VEYEVVREGRPIRFTSTLRIDDAVAACTRHGGDFACSLAEKAGQGLTPKQEAWLHKLALDQLAREKARIDGNGVDASSVVQLFEGQPARAGILIGGYRLSKAGAKAREPGSITVTSAAKNFDSRRWVGRITTDGRVDVSEEEALHAILRLAADPVGVLAHEGRRTGICAVCSRALTDPKSVTRGYGSTCARRFGLPLRPEESDDES
jgi:hypothetical protein